MAQIKLLHLHCLLNDESDKDEVFLKHKGQRIWPNPKRFHQMNSGERVSLNQSLSPDCPDLSIELWDWDLLSPNDLLGCFHIRLNPDDFGRFTASLNKKDERSTASYLLEWEIVGD